MFDIKYIVSTKKIPETFISFHHIQAIPVGAVTKKSSDEQEDEADWGPDHDSGKASHQQNPEEGENAAPQIS